MLAKRRDNMISEVLDMPLLLAPRRGDEDLN
jgi:hypothetical protein